jgi:YD repeat-containing protein
MDPYILVYNSTSYDLRYVVQYWAEGTTAKVRFSHNEYPVDLPLDLFEAKYQLCLIATGGYVITTVDPTSIDDIDDGYPIGKRWLNTATQQEYVLIDNTSGAAIWVSTTAGGGGGGGGEVFGSGAATRVAFWTNLNTLSSNSSFTFANDTLRVRYQQFDAATSKPAWAEGKVFYDQDEKSLAYYNDVSQTTVNLGQEEILRVYNDSGSTIPDGKVVYINGAQGQRPTVRLARADAKETCEIIGMATHAIAHNSYGYITTFGIVHDIPTHAFTVGSIVYLSHTTAGELVASIPPAPNRTVKVGIVTQSHPTNGHILVNPDIASSLEDLNNVWFPSTLANEHCIVYNATNQRFENRFITTADVKPLSTSIVYDGNGRVLTVTTSSGTKTMSYNPDGTLATITGTGSYRNKSFTYSGGILTGITVS